MEIEITKEKGRMKLSKLDRGCFLYAEQVENFLRGQEVARCLYFVDFLGISRAGLHCLILKVP